MSERRCRGTRRTGIKEHEMKSISLTVSPERFTAIREALAAITIRSMTVILYNDDSILNLATTSPDTNLSAGRMVKVSISVEDEQEEPVLFAISCVK